jgi:hypothetical protein
MRLISRPDQSCRVLLLKRSDVDTSLKDFEGYTAFDLYNSTLSSTKPSASNDDSAELFTWGANRSASFILCTSRIENHVVALEMLP